MLPAEEKWYALTGRIIDTKVEADGDIHLALQDANGNNVGTVSAEIPVGPKWCEIRQSVRHSPVLPFMAVADWSRSPSAPEVLVAGLIAVALLAAGFVAWLYFRSRIAAHAAFALYGLFSIATLLGEAT